MVTEPKVFLGDHLLFDAAQETSQKADPGFLGSQTAIVFHEINEMMKICPELLKLLHWLARRRRLVSACLTPLIHTMTPS